VRIAPVALALGALLVAWPALSAPRGKVVRVERGRARDTAARYCVVNDQPENILCLGTPPDAGEPITFVDVRVGVIGTARVTSSQSSKLYPCAGRTPTIFDANVTLTSGDRDVIARGVTVALRGVKLDERAKVIEDYQPPSPSEQNVLLAIDTNRSGDADIVLLQYTCDAQGNAMPLGSGGGNVNTQCYDTYVNRGDKLVRAHQDIIEICY